MGGVYVTDEGIKIIRVGFGKEDSFGDVFGKSTVEGSGKEGRVRTEIGGVKTITDLAGWLADSYKNIW